MSKNIIQSNDDKKNTKNITARYNTFKTHLKYSHSRVEGLHKNKSMPLLLNNKRGKQTQLSNNTFSQFAGVSGNGSSNSNTSNMNNKHSYNGNNNIKHKDNNNNIFDPTTSPFYPKNFNEYRHLLNPFIKLKDTDVKWSIQLAK